MTNTTLATIDNSHFGGEHTRNKKVDWNTCATCPTAQKGSCTVLCAEMERYLGANGNTISHNSPTEAQSQIRIADFDSAAESEFAPNTAHSKRFMQKCSALFAATETPESRLIDEERSREATSTILSHIASFSAQAAKEDARKRSMIESVLILHYLEDYNFRRIAEILGERFEEFAGYRTCTRKSGKKAGFTYTAPVGDDKAFRIVERFKAFVHSTHLSAAIHNVMATGTVEPIRKFATAAVA